MRAKRAPGRTMRAPRRRTKTARGATGSAPSASTSSSRYTSRPAAYPTAAAGPAFRGRPSTTMWRRMRSSRSTSGSRFGWRARRGDHGLGARRRGDRGGRHPRRQDRRHADQALGLRPPPAPPGLQSGKIRAPPRLHPRAAADARAQADRAGGSRPDRGRAAQLRRVDSHAGAQAANLWGPPGRRAHRRGMDEDRRRPHDPAGLGESQ